jgi:hypothetical protein
MERKDLLSQYSWIMKVLESCENESQIETSQKLFELYIKKWDLSLTEKNINTLSSHFEKEKKVKTLRLRKRGTSFFSKVSQFLLF